MDVSTPPSLDLACPQAKAELNKYVHMFRERGVDKTEHACIMIMIRTAYQHIISHAKMIIPSQSKAWIKNLTEK